MIAAGGILKDWPLYENKGMKTVHNTHGTALYEFYTGSRTGYP